MDTNSKVENPALDSELLNQMAGVAADATCAQRAWEDFYRRHNHYVLRVCQNAYSRQIGEARVSEVVQEVFVKAFRGAATFRPCPGQSADENRWHVRGWLGSILKNAVLDLYRDDPQEIFAEDIELFAAPDQRGDGSDEEEPIGSLEQAFMNLEERERDVLLETMHWHNPGAQQQRIPSEALDKLATRLNTSPANVRQIRLRAIAKLKRTMEEKL